MAYMSQEKKKQIAEVAKKIFKKYGVKGTFSVNHHMTLECNIKSGDIDFIANYNATCSQHNWMRFEPALTYLDVNEFHFKNHFTGVAKDFLTELLTAMNDGNFDKSDPQSDYFHVGWYVGVNIGKWNKPYICTNPSNKVSSIEILGHQINYRTEAV